MSLHGVINGPHPSDQLRTPLKITYNNFVCHYMGRGRGYVVDFHGFVGSPPTFVRISEPFPPTLHYMHLAARTSSSRGPVSFLARGDEWFFKNFVSFLIYLSTSDRQWLDTPA